MSTWTDVGNTVARFAPVLGAVVGGPAGASIGGIVAAALGTNSTPDAVAAALAGDPDAAIKLREIEARNAEVLAAINLDTMRAMIDDRKHARSTHGGHWMTWLLTLALVVMVAATLAALMMIETPMANKDVVYLVVGQLIGTFTTACAYWIGSSRGSLEKQETIKRM